MFLKQSYFSPLLTYFVLLVGCIISGRLVYQELLFSLRLRHYYCQLITRIAEFFVSFRMVVPDFSDDYYLCVYNLWFSLPTSILYVVKTPRLLSPRLGTIDMRFVSFSESADRPPQSCPPLILAFYVRTVLTCREKAIIEKGLGAIEWRKIGREGVDQVDEKELRKLPRGVDKYNPVDT